MEENAIPFSFWAFPPPGWTGESGLSMKGAGRIDCLVRDSGNAGWNATDCKHEDAPDRMLGLESPVTPQSNPTSSREMCDPIPRMLR